MRPHARFYSKPAIIIKYLNKPDAFPIGGTVPFFSYSDLVKRFKAFGTTAADKCFMHVTISLPKGMAATGRLWRRIVKTILAEYGFNPDATPWFAARHTDGSCDHIHVVISLRDFVGRRQTIWLDRRKTDQIHQHLCTMLGLPVPDYFDPKAAPCLKPTTPARNLKHTDQHQLFQDLQTIFLHKQPETIDGMGACLQLQPGRFQIAEAVNGMGTPSLKYFNGRDEFFGGVIGLAWQPRFVALRLAFCRVLRRARYGLQLSKLIDIFRKPEMEKHLERTITASRNARTATIRSDPLQAIIGNQGQGAGPLPPAGSARDTGRSKGNLGGTVGRTADRPDENIADLSGAISGTDRSDPRPNVCNRSCGENGPSANGRIGRKARPHLNGAERPYRLTLGELLVRVRGIAKRGRAGWQAIVRPGSKDIAVIFSDKSAVVVSAGDLQIEAEGKDGRAFSDKYRMAWAAYEIDDRGQPDGDWDANQIDDHRQLDGDWDGPSM
ncbi:MAG: hypothetical protein II336_02150 [Loktanella sp.]|nr:hypothetical protein [Loktanella sp.]